MAMDEKKYRFINIFLCFGVTLLLFGLVACIFSPDYFEKNLPQVLLLLQIIFGTILATTAIALTKKGYQLYSGLLFFGWGFNTYLVLHILPFSVKQWWPSYGILAGFFIVFTGLYIYKKIKAGFLFPALMVIIPSGVFFLFSFKIIKFSFIRCVVMTGPILIILSVIFFSTVYAVQKKTKKLILDDDQDAFEEEQLLVKFDDI